MIDSFASNPAGTTIPASNSAVVTPSDSADLAFLSRGIYVGSPGNISMQLGNDATPSPFNNVAAGTFFPFRVKRVYATGTTGGMNIVTVW